MNLKIWNIYIICILKSRIELTAISLRNLLGRSQGYRHRVAEYRRPIIRFLAEKSQDIAAISPTSSQCDIAAIIANFAHWDWVQILHVYFKSLDIKDFFKLIKNDLHTRWGHSTYLKMNDYTIALFYSYTPHAKFCRPIAKKPLRIFNWNLLHLILHILVHNCARNNLNWARYVTWRNFQT